MSFVLPEYRTPDFMCNALRFAPDAKTAPVLHDGVAPKNYHSMGINPEYFKVGGQWYLAEESRMDSVPVWRGKHVDVVEFRNLKVGDRAFIGRTEDGSEGERGFVTQHSLLQQEQFDRISTCGPKPMMMAVARYAKAQGIDCEASLENMMACGVGACLCCVEDTQEGHVCVCKQGPVFNINELKWQI